MIQQRSQISIVSLRYTENLLGEKTKGCYSQIYSYIYIYTQTKQIKHKKKRKSNCKNETNHETKENGGLNTWHGM